MRRKPEEELDEETAEAIEDQADDPETALAKKDKGALLRQCLTRLVGRAPGDHRSRLLPREVGGGSGGDRRHPGGDREDAHVLRAQEIVGNAEGTRNRSRLAMTTIEQRSAAERHRSAAAVARRRHAEPSRRAARRGGAGARSRARPPLRAGARGTGRNHSSQRDAGRAVGARDGEAVRQDRRRAGAASRRRSFNLGARVAEFFASLTPRTLACVGGAAVARHPAAGRASSPTSCMKENDSAGYETASAPSTEPGVGAFTLIRFAPQASVDDITKFLEANKLQVACRPERRRPLQGARRRRPMLPKGELGAHREETAGGQGRRLHRHRRDDLRERAMMQRHARCSAAPCC